MGDIVRLNDRSDVAHPGNPDDEVVKLLEGILERARAGEVVGFAAALVFHDDDTNDVRAGLVTRSQVGRLFALMQGVTRLLDE